MEFIFVVQILLTILYCFYGILKRITFFHRRGAIKVFGGLFLVFSDLLILSIYDGGNTFLIVLFSVVLLVFGYFYSLSKFYLDKKREIIVLGKKNFPFKGISSILVGMASGHDGISGYYIEIIGNDGNRMIKEGFNYNNSYEIQSISGLSNNIELSYSAKGRENWFFVVIVLFFHALFCLPTFMGFLNFLST